MSNHILSRLSADDSRLLQPHLEAVDLPVRKQLTARNRRVEHVYFLNSGIASIVANGDSELEIGIIGREGMTGASVVLGDDTPAPHQTYMQVAGDGHRLTAQQLRTASDASVSLLKSLLLFVHSLMRQTTDTALSNGRHKIEQRLARWLLMADDRLDGPDIPLTHEFLGVMLGTSRTGVTIALTELTRRGWITHQRGIVTIMDRAGLKESSNGAYIELNDK